MLNFLDDGDLGRVRRSIYVLFAMAIFCNFLQPKFSLKNGFLGLSPTVPSFEVGPLAIFFFLLILVSYFAIRFYLLSEIFKKGLADSKTIEEKLGISEKYAKLVAGITELISNQNANLNELKQVFSEWPSGQSHLREQKDIVDKIDGWQKELRNVKAIDVERVEQCYAALRQLVEDYSTHGRSGDYERVVNSLVTREIMMHHKDSVSERHLISAINTNNKILENMTSELSMLQQKVSQTFSHANSQLILLETHLSEKSVELQSHSKLKEALGAITRAHQEIQSTVESLGLLKTDARFTNFFAYGAAAIAWSVCLYNIVISL